MTDTKPGAIERVRVLNGHTDQESAHLVADYPYGRVLRCKIRYWIETAEKGAAKGQSRFVSQTTNPKVAGTVWNKPKASTYAQVAVMYLDGKDHVQWWGASDYLSPVDDARMRQMGIFEQLNDRDRARYGALLKISMGYARQWEEWNERVEAIIEHIRETGEDPATENGVFKVGPRLLWLGEENVPVYVAEARKRLTDSA